GVTFAWVILLANASMALIVFCFALTARERAVVGLLRQPGLLARSLFSMFVVAPLIAVTLALALDVDRALRAALVVLALSPVPPILPRQEIAIRGSATYAIGLLWIATMFSVFVVPLGLEAIGWLIDRPIALPFGVVARFAAISILAPLVAGAIVGRLAPG